MPLPTMEEANPSNPGISAQDSTVVPQAGASPAAQAQPLTPPPSGAIASPGTCPVAQAQPFTPPPSGATASAMSGQVFAGFTLARYVLIITATTIGILV